MEPIIMTSLTTAVDATPFKPLKNTNKATMTKAMTMAYTRGIAPKDVTSTIRPSAVSCSCKYGSRKATPMQDTKIPKGRLSYRYSTRSPWVTS